jgi:hypothetical protein
MTLEIFTVVKIQFVVGFVLIISILISGYLYFGELCPHLWTFSDQLRNYLLFKKDPVADDRNM